METNIHFWSYLTLVDLEGEMIHEKLKRNQNTLHITNSITTNEYNILYFVF